MINLSVAQQRESGYQERRNGDKIDVLYGALRLASKEDREGGLGAKRLLREKLSEGFDYTIRDVQGLIYRLDHSELCENTGRFVSILINRKMNQGDEVKLYMGERRLNFMGAHLRTGVLTIFGDVGAYLGYRATGGIIRVYGRMGVSAGKDLMGAEIFGFGGASKFLGKGMLDGRIFQVGEVGGAAGWGQLGGVLEVAGKVKFFSSRTGGGVRILNRELVSFTTGERGDN